MDNSVKRIVISYTQYRGQTLWKYTSPEKVNPFQGIGDLNKIWSNPSNSNSRQ
jgi:hypothetical protein